jgi:hypothetical protein
VQELQKGLENLTSIQKAQELLLQKVNARLESATPGSSVDGANRP